MARLQPLWLQSGSYAASQDRRLIGALWPDYRITGMAVTASTGNDVSIDAGSASVPAADGSGSLLAVATAPEVLTLPPAPATGLDRVDLVVAQIRGTDVDGGVNNDWIYAYVSGAEVAPPATAPPVPAGAGQLASVVRHGGAAAIAPADITDTRPGLALAVPPAPAPVKRYYLRAHRNAAYSFPATPNTLVNPFPWDTVAVDTDGCWQAGSYTYRCPLTGLYEVIAQVSTNLNNNTNISSRLTVNGTVVALSPSTNNSSGGASAWTAQGKALWWCNAGDTIGSAAASNMASSALRAPAPTEAFLMIAFLGPP